MLAVLLCAGALAYLIAMLAWIAMGQVQLYRWRKTQKGD